MRYSDLLNLFSFVYLLQYLLKMTSLHSNAALESIDDEEQALFGDITAAFEERSLVDVHADEETARLQQELELMNASKVYIDGRRSQKRGHTNLAKTVRQHMAQHGIGTEIRKSELRDIRQDLSTKFQQAVKYHRQFVEKVPNLSEKRQQVCAKWLEEFEAAHKEVIEEIDQHLGQRSTAPSMVESPDLEQTVGNLVNQLGEVQQQLTSQEQQFQQLAKKLDDKFDSISSKIRRNNQARNPARIQV